jgi:hypothetical protein
MALLDDRRQLGLTGDRENDIADAPRWFENGGAIFDHGSGGIVLLRAA